MLRRGAADCYSQSCAICRHLGHIVQFTRMPNKTLPARGFSAEYFPQFFGVRYPHEADDCHRAAAQKSRCGPMDFERLNFALGSSQRCRNALKRTSTTCT
jgi:hypothetical protein